MHEPVLTAELMEHLAVRADGVYYDATCGLGGHTALIASKLDTGFVIAADRDAESLEIARRNTAPLADRIRFVHARFSQLEETLRRFEVEKLSGLIADLGVSRHQLTSPERGFSFMAAGPLDMRCDRTEETTAADIVNYTAEKALADIIFRYGEERRARRIARAIVRARPIRDTRHLVEVIESVAPRTGRLSAPTLTFQGLRIAVNRELEEIDSLLDAASRSVGAGGRIVVIGFHSLESRPVKQCFQRLVREGRARLLTRHVVRPTDEEVARNPAARSAILRAIEML